jgi:hypothetical protein
MSTPDSIAMPASAPVTGDTARRIGSPEMIDRLATEMRARSGGELPHSYYVEAVRRKLGGLPSELPGEIPSGITAQTPAANDTTVQPSASSVFHAWAIGER